MPIVICSGSVQGRDFFGMNIYDNELDTPIIRINIYCSREKMNDYIHWDENNFSSLPKCAC